MQPTTLLERWAAVPGYEGRYEVSSEGRVRSLTRRPRVLKLSQRSLRDPYLAVTLWYEGSAGRKVHSIHSLVMAAFVGPKPDGLVVRHLNGDPTDNRLSNLRYGTYAENAADSILHGTNHAVHVTARSATCLRGHVYTPETTAWITQRGGQLRRSCITCRRERDRLYRQRDPEKFRAKARSAAARARLRRKANPESR